MTAAGQQGGPPPVGHLARPPERDAIAGMEPFAGLGLDAICVVASQQQAQAARDELLRHAAVGFDTESRPSFVSGEVSDGPHVLQFSTPDRAYIFQSHRTETYAAFYEILETPTVIKVGFGLKSDLKQLAGKFGIQPAAIIDLGGLFKKIGYKYVVGAKTAVAILFNKKLAKSKRLTTSNWSNKELSEGQILYAANDAHAAIAAFLALRDGKGGL